PSAVVLLTSGVDSERFARRVPWDRANDPLTLGVDVMIATAFEERAGGFAGEPVALQEGHRLLFQEGGIGSPCGNGLYKLRFSLSDLSLSLAPCLLCGTGASRSNMLSDVGQRPWCRGRVDLQRKRLRLNTEAKF